MILLLGKVGKGGGWMDGRDVNTGKGEADVGCEGGK